MPGDSYHRDVVFGKDQQACWDVLTDVSKLASWVDILHSVVTIGYLERYEAILESRVGPVRLKAPLTVDVTVGAPGSVVGIHAEGTDPQVNSSISIDVEMRLEAAPGGGTAMTLDATYSVLGKVASMGGGIIKKKADKVLEQFFGNAETELA